MKKDRNQNSVPLSEALDSYFKALGIDKDVHIAKVLAKWPEVMGEAVAKRTEKIYLKNGVLHLEINSSVMRDELFQQKTEIKNKLNALAGYEMVSEVFFA